jgi:hypothetical protein
MHWHALHRLGWREDQLCIVMSRNGPASDAGSFERASQSVRLSARRAGAKIWGKEREVAAFSEAKNCKDPRYR